MLFWNRPVREDKTAMSKRAFGPGNDSPSIETEETFGSIWLKHCAEPGSGHSDMPPLRKALRNATARLNYRHVRYVEFKELSSAGNILFCVCPKTSNALKLIVNNAIFKFEDLRETARLN